MNVRIIYFITILVINGSCNFKHRFWDTPKKYKYQVDFDSSLYEKDKLFFLEETKQKFLQKEEPFYSNKAIKIIELSIDTIVYNPDKTRAAFFVISKFLYKNYENYREGKLISIEDKILYDGHSYLAKKDSNFVWKVYHFGFLNPVNYDNQQDLSARIREMYFHDLATLERSFCKYNFDDIRMWDESIWKKF